MSGENLAKWDGFLDTVFFMIGPPGAGKTLLARALPGIMPVMDIDEALQYRPRLNLM